MTQNAEPSVEVLYDDLFTYTVVTGGQHTCVCHLRVYRTPHLTVAIAGELFDNPGASVTNGWGSGLDAALRDRFGPDLVLMEHYPPSPVRPGDQARHGAFDFYRGPGRWEASTRGYVENLLVGRIVEVWPEREYTQATIRARARG